ncbi:hypothetical protein GCM10022251_30310 [Phytohabitans flavus]|uniref:Uncharacterized protein n=1 Tax=Phytohabitans flavus TaxID=1076124 RepID=A0A6F8XX29_9ACTN|nr:hypothetical protein Pflav_047950 [Phytohabitans flavus]
MQAGKDLPGRDHIRVVLTERDLGALQGLVEHYPGTGEVAGVTQRTGILLRGSERRRLGHARHAAWQCRLRATRVLQRRRDVQLDQLTGEAKLSNAEQRAGGGKCGRQR